MTTEFVINTASPLVVAAVILVCLTCIVYILATIIGHGKQASSDDYVLKPQNTFTHTTTTCDCDCDDASVSEDCMLMASFRDIAGDGRIPQDIRIKAGKRLMEILEEYTPDDDDGEEDVGATGVTAPEEKTNDTQPV